MNGMIEKTLLFVGGLAIGGLTGYVSAKMILEKKYYNIAEQQIHDMEEYYKKSDTYRRESTPIFEDDAEINPAPENNTNRAAGILSQSARDEIKEKLIKNYETTSNYATIYAEKHPEVFETKSKSVSSEILRDGVDDGREEEEIDEATKANIEHEKHKNDPPKIISADEYDNLPPHIDTQTLYFYHDDETLLDDNDEVIEDPAVLIGSALNDGDFIDNIGEPLLFVYNPSLDTAYEIQRVEGAYYG